MFKLIFSCAFLFFALLFVGLGVLKGRKYLWGYSAARAGVVAVSAVLSTVLSVVVAGAIADAAYNMILNMGILGNAEGFLRDIPSAPEAFRAIVAMFLAPAFFFTFFLIIKAILNLITKIVAKIIVKSVRRSSETKSEENDAAADTAEATEAKEAKEETEITEITENLAENADAEEVAEIVEAAELAEDERNENKEEVLTEDSSLGDVALEEASATETKKDKKQKKEKKKRNAELRATGINPLGMLFGGVSSFLLLIVILIPFVGPITVADGAIGLVGANSSNKIIGVVDEISDAAANNIGSKTVKALGGNVIYSALTTYEVGGQKVTLPKEAKFLTATGNAIAVVADKDVPRADAAGEVREVAEAFSNSTLIPVLAPEFLNSANASWEKGEAFHGIKKPAIGGEKMSALTDPILEIFGKSDSNTIKTDVGTLVNVIAIMVEQDVTGLLKEDPMGILSHDEITASILYELLMNERMSPVVGAISEYGVQMMGEQLNMRKNREGMYDSFVTDTAQMISETLGMSGEAAERTAAVNHGYIKLFDRYGVDVQTASIEALTAATEACFTSQTVNEENVALFLSTASLTLNDGRTVVLSSQETLCEVSLLVALDQIDFDSSSITNKTVESKALSLVLKEAAIMIDDLKANGFSATGSIKKLGSILDAFAATETAGRENTGRILLSILQSEKVYSEVGFTLLEATDIGMTINEKSSTHGYVSLMASLSNTIEIVQMSANNEDITEKVEVLLEDLTPESAEVLQKMSSPSVMTNHGVPERSADATANMMSDMFGNLADAKANGMSDEQYEKEAKATSDMINLAMSAGSGDSNATFGENSATGIEASEYVNNVFESQVISATVVNTVYPEGQNTPVIDPLNSERSLSDTEKTDILTSLNERWANASDAEKADVEYQKTYIAIGAMMNIPIQITDSGIVG